MHQGTDTVKICRQRPYRNQRVHVSMMMQKGSPGTLHKCPSWYQHNQSRQYQRNPITVWQHRPGKQHGQHVIKHWQRKQKCQPETFFDHLAMKHIHPTGKLILAGFTGIKLNLVQLILRQLLIDSLFWKNHSFQTGWRVLAIKIQFGRHALF